jgi:uncharacterized membrane protein YfcA
LLSAGKYTHVDFLCQVAKDSFVPQVPLFLALGITVGALGTLIGAGGGFLLVPVLMFLLPDKSPEQITAISLFAVACNSFSGSMAYLFRGQVHVRSAVVFSIASLPGAIMGTHLIGSISRTDFELIFSALLLSLGSFLILRKSSKRLVEIEKFIPSAKTYVLGASVSFVVAFVATFLGIGGGIIHVPLMSEFLAFPVHLATGTSHLVLAITSSVASIQHVRLGNIHLSEPFLGPLAAGMIVGAQMGAAISKRVHGQIILRLLGGALILVALRLAARNL